MRFLWLFSLTLIVVVTNLAEAEEEDTDVKVTESRLEPEPELANRVERDAETKKSKRKCKKNDKKCKRNRSKRNRNRKSKNGKKKRKSNNGKRKSKSQKSRNGRQPKIQQRQPSRDCEETALCTKLKAFVAYDNQLRKAKRIKKFVDTMKKKGEKAASAFKDTLEALETQTNNGTGCGSGGNGNFTAVKPIYDKLKNCSSSAKEKCDYTKIPNFKNDTVVSCITILTKWVQDYKVCIKKAACCSCLTALPDLSSTNPECTDFTALNTQATKFKASCTGNSEAGSFGDCRSQQSMAGSVASGCDNRCSPSSTGTTAGGRMRRRYLAHLAMAKQKNM